MDSCKIGSGLYQYTAIDDCTRYRVLRLYKRRTAANNLDFLDCVIEETPFPIQHFQTDRGSEFFALKVQRKLREYCINFDLTSPPLYTLTAKLKDGKRLIKQNSTQQSIYNLSI